MRKLGFLILFIALLTIYGSKIYSQENLNDLQENQQNENREYAIACLKQQLKANYTEDMLVEGKKVFKGIGCSYRGFGVEGYERWEYLGEIDKVETKPCQISGNIQYQWTLKDYYGKKYTKLVSLRKANECKTIWGVNDGPVEVAREYYPVKWSCSKINYKSVSDPYETGMNCSPNSLR